MPLFEPVVERLRRDGHDVVLTARDHAQTVDLARTRWPELRVVGGESPGGRAAKLGAVLARANELRRVARSERPDVALSHGSYAQVVAARASRVPAVTMMDYEYQPANHLSFRLAERVVVPRVFPTEALRRFGAAESKVIRYDGFKEELYLAGFRPDPAVLDELSLDPNRVIAVFRPAPEGALYHPRANERFSELLAAARAEPEVQVVLLPRTRAQRKELEGGDGVVIPKRAVDGRALLALADLTVGGGGTMNRESALLGTPTYTVFAGKLAAVDAELIRLGLLRDLRDPTNRPEFVKKARADRRVTADRAQRVLAALEGALAAVVR